MLERIRTSLTYANVMSTIAVFIVLGGGAYAATKLPKNSVGTKQIKNRAVTKAKLAKGVLTAGPKGDTGPQGSAGAKGDKGDQGTQGLQGEQGLKGEQGIQGSRGPSDLKAFSSAGPSAATGTALTGLLPTGKYLVIAKADLTNTANAVAPITCSIQQSMQGAVDSTSVIVPAANSNTGKTDIVVQAPITITATSNFLILNCTGSATVEVRDMTMNALQVENIN